jgi:hypothetical protein
MPVQRITENQSPSNSGAGLQPRQVAMHINAGNNPGNCFIVRSLSRFYKLMIIENYTLMTESLLGVAIGQTTKPPSAVKARATAE